MHQGNAVWEGRAEDVSCVLQAIRTAAESMAVTPLRLTNAVGMPWRRVCSVRSTQARAGSSAARAERRRRAAVDRCRQAMAKKISEPRLCRAALAGAAGLPYLRDFMALCMAGRCARAAPQRRCRPPPAKPERGKTRSGTGGALSQRLCAAAWHRRSTACAICGTSGAANDMRSVCRSGSAG